MSPSGMLLPTHCMQSSLSLSLCDDLALSLPQTLPVSVQMGCGSWGTLWRGIKAGERRLTEFATLPIIQMILNANYPPQLCRERPVTQDAARVCRASWSQAPGVCRWRSQKLQYCTVHCWTAAGQPITHDQHTKRHAGAHEKTQSHTSAVPYMGRLHQQVEGEFGSESELQC